MKVDICKFTFGKDFFVSEASTLGFPVGQWPRELKVYNSKNGNEFDFFLKKIFYVGEEVGGAIYANNGAWKLKIFND